MCAHNGEYDDCPACEREDKRERAMEYATHELHELRDVLDNADTLFRDFKARYEVLGMDAFHLAALLEVLHPLSTLLLNIDEDQLHEVTADLHEAGEALQNAAIKLSRNLPRTRMPATTA